MPHFIIDCSENILTLQSPEDIMQTVYDAAESSGLFAEGDIKVRINSFKYFNTENTKNDFLHIFAYIMEGRDTGQKAGLSKKMIIALKKILPGVPVISMNIKDFEKSTYCKKSMV